MAEAPSVPPHTVQRYRRRRPDFVQRTPWKTFLQTHGEGLAAADLFTVEVLTLAGLRRYFVFFVIALKTRRVHIAGIHPQPDGRWMEQMARNLTDPVDGFLRTVRQRIHDCDPLYTRVFGEILTSGDVGPIRLPPKSPNLNAYAERFVRSIKEECLHRVAPGSSPWSCKIRLTVFRAMLWPRLASAPRVAGAGCRSDEAVEDQDAPGGRDSPPGDSR